MIKCKINIKINPILMSLMYHQNIMKKYIVHIIIIIYTYKNSLKKNHLIPIQWKLQVVVKRIKRFN